MKNLIFTLVILVSFNSFGQTSKIYDYKYVDSGVIMTTKISDSVTYYDTGQIKEIVGVLDGNKQGLEIGFYKSGKLEYHIYYIDNVIQGKGVLYYENGKIKREDNFKNGKQHGITKIYNEIGLNYENTYNMGVIQGYSKYYFSKTGQLQSEGNIKNGKRIGTWKVYDEEGNIIFENDGSYLDKAKAEIDANKP